ncbi:Mov34/MPN/PAD-1 family protein [Knoellia locipacati]|uniref:Mov34/MPN/PAD-1 family protein n=1 Tax=Knoellia locipacati TaxID=882824 RepID=UPI00384B0192
MLTHVEDAARQAAPKETGGILTGWREGDSVVVRHALTVTDPEAQHSQYQRNHAAAETALSAHLREMSDERLGYVGEWHTHPLPQDPSGKDWASVRRIASVAGGSVALIVAALDPGTLHVRTHAGIGRRNRLGRAITQKATVNLLEMPTSSPIPDNRSDA